MKTSIYILLAMLGTTSLFAQAPGTTNRTRTFPRAGAPTSPSTTPGANGLPGRTGATPPAIPAFPAPPAASARTVVPSPGGAAPAGAGATAAAAKDEFVSFSYEKMPLGQFIELYAEQVGKTILRAQALPVDSVFMTLKPRGPLAKTDAIMAMETVLAMNGYTVVPVGEKFIKVLASGEASTAGAEFSTSKAENIPLAGRFITQIVDLKYVTPQDASSVIQAFASGKTGASIVPLQNNQMLILRDYSENIKRMVEVIEKIDVVVPLIVKPEVIPMKYTLAADIQTVLDSLTSNGGGGVTIGSNRNGSSSFGSSRGNSGLGGSLGGSASGSLNQGNPTGAFGASSAARSNFGDRVNRIARSAAGGDFQILGSVKIIADERTNSLLIFASDQDMIMIKTIIAQLDVVLAQVLIEALIMEVSLSDGQATGISYLQEPKKLGSNSRGGGGVQNGQNYLNPAIQNFLASGTNSGATLPGNLPSGFSYFTTIGNSFDVGLTAFANDSRVNVLSRPRIQTSHAVAAHLFIGDTVPYVTGTYFGGVNSSSSSQYQQKDVGIELDVEPLINPDGLVVMKIAQNIEQLGTPTKIDNNDVPTTSKRVAESTVAVRDRETIVLGGMISTLKTTGKSGVPYLKDIPGLGRLFRSDSSSNKRVELMVFLRPTVLPTPEAASLAASEMRESLPGVRQGTYEIEQEERKRNEAIEKDMRKKLGIKEPKKGSR